MTIKYNIKVLVCFLKFYMRLGKFLAFLTTLISVVDNPKIGSNPNDKKTVNYPQFVKNLAKTNWMDQNEKPEQNCYGFALCKLIQAIEALELVYPCTKFMSQNPNNRVHPGIFSRDIEDEQEIDLFFRDLNGDEFFKNVKKDIEAVIQELNTKYGTYLSLSILDPTPEELECLINECYKKSEDNALIKKIEEYANIYHFYASFINKCREKKGCTNNEYHIVGVDKNQVHDIYNNIPEKYQNKDTHKRVTSIREGFYGNKGRTKILSLQQNRGRPQTQQRAKNQQRNQPPEKNHPRNQKGNNNNILSKTGGEF